MKIKINILLVFAFFVLLLLSGVFSAGELLETSSVQKIAVPIIIYHKIQYTHLSTLVISPYEFESDLKYIEQQGYTTILMKDLIDYVYHDTPLPDKPIILTFDDGYYNNYKFAYPLLEKYNMKAVLSVIGKTIDEFSKIKIDDPELSYLTWGQAIELQASGCFEIQNHSYNLHSMDSKRIGCNIAYKETKEHYEGVLTDDIGYLQQLITEKTGVTPNTFNYPYGYVCNESISIIKKIGFKASLSCKYGINIICKDPEILFCLKRISRYHQVTLKNTLDKAFKTIKTKSLNTPAI